MLACVKRVALHTVAFAFALLALAGVPAAASPGRNGAIVFLRRTTTFIHRPGGDSATIKRELGVRSPSGAVRVLASCTLDFDALGSACSTLTYADPAVSPNGRLVAFNAGKRVGLVGIGGGPVRLLPQHSEFDRTPAFSPDGKRLVFTTVAHSQPSLAICDLACRRPRALVRGGDDATWSVRGWIAFVYNGAVYRVRPDSRGLRRLASGAYVGASWSPDGKRLALARADTLRKGKVLQTGGVVVIDADGRHTHALRAAAAGLDPTSVTWSPDGRRLLVLDAVHRRLVELDPRGRLLSEDPWAFPLAVDNGHIAGTDAVAWQPLR
jgi:dipeptidyl aminopeptidase/acylaminoacyl peptidase